MLRPERMSRVSVTGSKRVMDDTVEAVHDLNLVHVTEYDGAWEGFEPGDPVEGADEASDKLVTVRSLQSILGVDPEDAGPPRIVNDDALEEELEEIRTEVNELDDERSELEDDLRSVEERIDAVEPFADVGIDLDLLSGYDRLSVAVGEGDPEAVRETLVDTEGVEEFEIRTGDDAMAVFVYPAVDLEDVLVGAEFTTHEIPEDAEGTPEEYVSELEHRKQQLESKLDTVEDELEDVRLEESGFLLAAEEKLSIEVQKREAPLSFATTENAFVAEGWIPSERVTDFKQALQSEVGDHVDVEELEQADYDSDGHATAPEEIDAGDTRAGGEEVAADGGVADDRPMSDSEPPVVQDNPGAVRPFEALTKVINRPKYHEFDPTVILFLTFPLFFGFMIGDLGYGLLYVAIGYLIYDRAESEVVQSLGAIGVWAGAFTALFGVLYGEIFGLHILGEIVWPSGEPPIKKGLNPKYVEYSQAWLVLSLVAGVLHLTVGWIFDFVENLDHGFAESMYESGSWLMMMYGLWAWIFAGAAGVAPGMLVGQGSVFNGNPIPLGFTGLPGVVGTAGLAVFFVGLVLLVYGEPVEGVEFLNVLVHVLSYTRIAAVLLAKAGMALAVNLIVFGATFHDGAFHYALFEAPTEHVVFPGLIHMGPLALLFGIVVLVLGHALVLALGITSAGLQAVRLEYVEFFGKFYEGGGETYSPFGYVREFTTED